MSVEQVGSSQDENKRDFIREAKQKVADKQQHEDL